MKFVLELIQAQHDLLVAYNSTKFQNIEAFRQKAVLCHRLWRESLGRYAVMPQSFHTMLAHGHLFLRHFQHNHCLSMGELTEASGEAANKTNKEFDTSYSRKTSLADRKQDCMTRHLTVSHPHVLAYQDMQVLAIGRMPKGRPKQSL